MKEIRNTKQVTVEEVKFIAEDGTEFEVTNKVSEAEAERNCKLYEESQKKQEISFAFEKIKKIDASFSIVGEEKTVIAVINNFDEWKTLCFYLQNKYYEASDNGFDVLIDEPISYPAIISYQTQFDESISRIGSYHTDITDNDGNVLDEKTRTINGSEFNIFQDKPINEVLSDMKKAYDVFKNFVDSIEM